MKRDQAKMEDYGLVTSASTLQLMANEEIKEMTPTFLRHYCDQNNLDKVSSLEIELDSQEQQIDSVGEFLPGLESLKLNGSSIQTIRDLGTHFKNVKFLWLNRAGLRELEGIASLPSLEELYISFNEVSELQALQFHETLQVLDLEGNRINDIHEVFNLASCPVLTELTIEDNPFCKKHPDYLFEVKTELSQLQTLDSMMVQDIEPVPTLETSKPSPDKHLPKDDILSFSDDGNEEDRPCTMLALKVQDVGSEAVATPTIDEEEPDERELIVESVKATRQQFWRNRCRPSSGGSDDQRPWTSASCTKWTMSAGSRPMTTSTGILDDDRLSTALSSSSLGTVAPVEAASELTQSEEVLVGNNPLRAIRQRRKTAGMEKHYSGNDSIHHLLQKFQSYLQPSMLGPEELSKRKKVFEDAGARPRTADVRIHEHHNNAPHQGGGTSSGVKRSVARNPGMASLVDHDSVANSSASRTRGLDGTLSPCLERNASFLTTTRTSSCGSSNINSPSPKDDDLILFGGEDIDVIPVGNMVGSVSSGSMRAQEHACSTASLAGATITQEDEDDLITSGSWDHAGSASSKQVLLKNGSRDKQKNEEKHPVNRITSTSSIGDVFLSVDNTSSSSSAREESSGRTSSSTKKREDNNINHNSKNEFSSLSSSSGINKKVHTPRRGGLTSLLFTRQSKKGSNKYASSGEEEDDDGLILEGAHGAGGGEDSSSASENSSSCCTSGSLLRGGKKISPLKLNRRVAGATSAGSIDLVLTAGARSHKGLPLIPAAPPPPQHHTSTQPIGRVEGGEPGQADEINTDAPTEITTNGEILVL